jgi:hypothetical protein
MNKKEKKFCLECLRQYLSGASLPVSLAIYRDDLGRLSCSPYAGVPGVAADGSDEVIWTWEEGDYDRTGDIAAMGRRKFHNFDERYLADDPECIAYVEMCVVREQRRIYRDGMSED